MFDFLTKNFAVLSAAALGLSSVLVIVFMFGYLQVFDWNLIWIIEYTDMTKFIVITIAIVCSLYVYGIGYVNAINSAVNNELELTHKVALTVALSLPIILLLLAYYSGNINSEHATYFVLSIIFIYLEVAWTIGWSKQFMEKTNFQKMQFVLGTLIGVSIIGHSCGLYVRDLSEMRHDVYVGNGVLRAQRIVMLLSHHSVFFKDGSVTLVQSADVKRIVSTPAVAAVSKTITSVEEPAKPESAAQKGDVVPPSISQAPKK